MTRKYTPRSREKIGDALAKNSAPSGDCVVWTAARSETGYGITTDCRGVKKTAHRVAWWYWNGAIPRGMCVMHDCDNRACINPFHLRLGTHAQNVTDMKAKGRAKTCHGSDHGGSKLTIDDVVLIRRSAIPARVLAAQIGVTVGHISAVRRRKAWAHI